MEQHTKSHLLTTKKTPIKKTKTAAKHDNHEPQHDKMNTKNHVIVLSCYRTTIIFYINMHKPHTN